MNEDLVNLAGTASEYGEIAVRPDHPFLLHGPELLFGSRGLLLAFFLAGGRIRSGPDSLLARLALARLALPSHTLCVAVFGSRVGNLAPELRAENNFHILLDLSSGAEAQRVLSKPEPNARAQEIPPRVRHQQRSRAAYLLRIADEVALTQSGRDRGKSVSSQRTRIGGGSWTGRHRRDPGLPRDSDRPCWVVGSSSDDVRTPSSLRRAVESLTLRSYVLDNGVPHPTSSGGSVIASLGPIRSSQDPTKPRRAAAFAGACLVERVDEESLIDVERHLGLSGGTQ